MLKEELNKKSKVPDLEMVLLKHSIPLIISDEILNKIKFLCSRIAEDEWSGVLFYSVEGTISNFTTVKFKVEDIFLMDKGSKAATEYELDDSLIDYRMSNPESLKWKIGHIHSHNTMDVYFSGVDLSELNDNSEFHNYYLSLIVNNFMKMRAKVAFRGKSTAYECKNEKGEIWNLRLAEKSETMFVFDCDIQSEGLKVQVDDAFSQRVDDIIKKEESNKATFKKNAEKFLLIKDNEKPWYLRPEQSYNSKFNSKSKSKSLIEKYEKEQEDEEELAEAAMVEFVNYILNLGEYRLEEFTIEETLEDIVASGINQVAFAGKLMGMYPEMYEKHFRNTPNAKSLTMEDFVDTTNEVITVLEEFEGDYTVVDSIINNLELLLNKLMANV